MAVFSKYFTENEVESESLLADVDVDSIFEDEKIETPFEESSIETAARFVAETTENYNKIMEACAIMEFNFLEENGREFIYEADGTGFFAKAKEFFLKIWEKIQALFKKAIGQFNVWFTSDKDFLKKYEKSIAEAKRTKKSLADKEVSVYEYAYLGKGALNVLDSVTWAVAAATDDVCKDADLNKAGIESHMNKSVEDLKKVIEDNYTTDNMTEFTAKMRASMLSSIASKAGASYSGNSADSKEFSSELTEMLQGGSSKESKKLSEVIDTAIDFLKNSEGIKKAMNASVKSAKTEIDKTIKEITQLETTYKKYVQDTKDNSDRGDKAGYCHTLCGKAIAFHKDCKSTLMTAQGIALNTLKACSRQSKAICVKVVTLTESATVESAALEEGAVGGFLDRINLV